MATPQQAPLPDPYEMLSELYLGLWEQLDLITGEGKWFDSGPPPHPQELQAEVAGSLERVQRRLDDPGILKRVEQDYRRTQELLQRPLPDVEFAEFKVYLRDQGLGYARAMELQE